MATAAAGNCLLTGYTRRDETAEMRHIAVQMEVDNPAWIVVFGAYTGQFVAFPRFDAPTEPFITALYPAALLPRMRAIEAKARRAIACTRPGTGLGDADTITFRSAA